MNETDKIIAFFSEPEHDVEFVNDNGALILEYFEKSSVEEFSPYFIREYELVKRYRQQIDELAENDFEGQVIGALKSIWRKNRPYTNISHIKYFHVLIINILYPSWPNEYLWQSQENRND